MKKELLVIDDDQKLGELLTNYLSRFGYNVFVESHPAAGLAALKRTHFDLLILDVMLPEMDGFEVLKTLRHFSKVPVIMLTARGDTMDRIVGLELGADDYLPKPFEPRELQARIQTILRRVQQTPDDNEALRCADLLVDVFRRTITLAATPLDLTTMEYEILLLMMRNPSRVMSRDDIMDALRGIEWDAFNRSIDVSISRLRAKLNDDARSPRFIKTIWGRGYQFVGVVEREAH